jgi:hypothetical protein
MVDSSSQALLQAYVPDDERDAVLDRLLALPENKVSRPTQYNVQSQ